LKGKEEKRVYLVSPYVATRLVQILTISFEVQHFWAKCVACCDAEFAGCNLLVGFDEQFTFWRHRYCAFAFHEKAQIQGSTLVAEALVELILRAILRILHELTQPAAKLKEEFLS
jgi:hypothetical protein